MENIKIKYSIGGIVLIKKKLSFILIFLMIISPIISYGEVEITSKAAILMDYSTGNIIYSLNEHEKLIPASITKIMTLLLTMEAVESGRLKLTDKVVISEYASSMGGTQIYLEPGEMQTIEDLIRATSIRSANDAAVALGEAISGSNEAFVKLMNDRAKSLGMDNTHFMNASGLPIDDHYTSAYDVALMSREILKYDYLSKFFISYMEDIKVGRNKDDTQTMVNTNKLIRDYEGTTGIKTGSIDAAGYCVSASAKRGELHLIAVVLGAQTSNVRFNEAKKLLDFGFANYDSVNLGKKGDIIATIPVEKADLQTIELVLERDVYALINKDKKGEVKKEALIPGSINPPISKGDRIGELLITVEEMEVDRVPLVAKYDVNKANILLLFKRTISSFITGK